MRKRVVPFVLLLALAAGMLPGRALAGTPQALTVTKAGAGRGTVTSDVQPGIDCGTTCSADFPFGTVVTLTAAPKPSSAFAGWTGDCSGTGTCQVTMDAPHTVRAVFDLSYRPDGWIKLCGQSTGCTINPPPHPWHGNNIYNTTGRRQTIRQSIDNGEGVRYFILVENDGAAGDTVTVQGCRGNRYFIVNKVLLGKQKRPNWRATDLTRRFKNGTLSFTIGPSSQNEHKVFTLNIVTSDAAVGVSYRCNITMVSQGDPSSTDTLVAKMSGF
jgi:hypothetical protein